MLGRESALSQTVVGLLMVSVNCRARIKQQRKEGLLSAFLMMLSNIVVKQRSGRKFSRHSFVVLSHCFH